jgi:hypothetical protein
MPDDPYLLVPPAQPGTRRLPNLQAVLAAASYGGRDVTYENVSPARLARSPVLLAAALAEWCEAAEEARQAVLDSPAFAAPALLLTIREVAYLELVGRWEEVWNAIGKAYYLTAKTRVGAREAST